MDEDFLCSLQKRHGEDFLTATCQSFPRITYRLDEEIFEQSMTLTCPIAAKIILLRTVPINFVEVEEIKTRAIIRFKEKLSYPTDEFINLQMRAIKILQTRNLTINERLKKFCEMFSGENFSDVNFDSVEHAKNLIEIFNKMYSANLSEENKKNLCKNYLDNRGEILTQIYINFSNVAENYLVNEFFMRCYPSAFSGGVWENCKIFVTAYRILEFSIVLTVISKKFLSVEDFINLICSVNDMLDHSKGGMDTIKNFSKNCDAKNFFALMVE